jgi:hypothetical protein
MKMGSEVERVRDTGKMLISYAYFSPLRKKSGQKKLRIVKMFRSLFEIFSSW